jgi:hypothetical protein
MGENARVMLEDLQRKFIALALGAYDYTLKPDPVGVSSSGRTDERFSDP